MTTSSTHDPSAALTAREKNTRAVQGAFVLAIIVGLILTALLIVAAVAIGGVKEQLGAAVGMGLSLIVTLPTLVTAFWGIKGKFSALAVSVLGTWLVKMGGLIIAVIALRDAPWMSMQWAGFGLLLGAVVPTLVEIAILLRERPALEV